MTNISISHQSDISLKREAVAKASERLSIIDLFRGVAHVIMAFDHSGYFSGSTMTPEAYNGVVGPIGHWYNFALGLFTNVVTPIFFTLTGVSVSFFEKSRRKRGWTEWEITRFLLTRALILFGIDMTIGTLYWQPYQSFEVFSAVACCLVILAFIRLLPLRLIAFIGAASFFTYPLLIHPFPPVPGQTYDLIPSILFIFNPDSAPRVGFTLIGRIPIVIIGYVLGRLLQDKKLVISPRLIWVAVALFAGWFVIRLGGGYGNFFPFKVGMPWYYFLIENKEPTSIAYNLFNMGGAVLVLLVVNHFEKWLKGHFIGRVLISFGQTSLFFYVVHLLIFSKILSQIITPNFLPHEAFIRTILMSVTCILMMIPLSFGYRELRRKYPDSILRYL